MADSKDPIDAAIESAESLIASFLVREKAGHQADGAAEETDTLTGNEVSQESDRKKDTGYVQDPEQSLFIPPDQSLVTEGIAYLWPNHRTASSQATFPELGNLSPRQSLDALGWFITQYNRRRSVRGLHM